MRSMMGIVFLLAMCWSAAATAAGVAFARVELDRFIEKEQARHVTVSKGRRLITMAAPVSFRATIKRMPESRAMSYVYTALRVAGVEPMPVVEHRMFIESEAGRIIPVYVEKEAASRIADRMRQRQWARFRAYHLYSYSKGPALLVVGFDQERQP